MKKYETFLPELVDYLDDIFDSGKLDLNFKVIDKKFSNIQTLDDLVQKIKKFGENVEPGRYVYRYVSKKPSDDICYILDLFEFGEFKAERADILLFPEDPLPNIYKCLFKTTDEKEYMLLFAGEF